MRDRRDQITSPYLLDHIDNPVDWREWGDEAFAEARRRDVPVFLSIGYSACHWCHVMAHESFEDDAVAAYLNEHFVSIKVDREERPDVDAIYMDATVSLTGQGGWPMSVFLDQDGRPFYAGTYFPPEPRHGLPSFMQLLVGLDDAWRQRREDVLASGQRIVAALTGRGRPNSAERPPTLEELTAAVRRLEATFDQRWGGFGGAPKFPPSMVLEFLLRYSAMTGDESSLAMAVTTLEAMARGGLFDQVGGGFARYSVDSRWIVPHFEKMLYDNALLLRVYAHWWRLTGSPLAERVVRETAAFLLRDMRTPEGGFAAALDADSEGREGAFYAWNPQQLIDALGEDDGAWAADLLSVTQDGTFEDGLSTLQLLQDPDDAERWSRLRRKVWEARERRVHPGRDDKVVASWNGLVIAALAEAGALFREPEWIEAAAAAGDLLVAVHLGAQDDDRLVRTSRDGVPGNTAGVLDDYSCVAEGFQALYAVTGDDAWLTLAGMLIDVAVQHFSDGSGGFYSVADDVTGLFNRPSDPTDNAEPSGWMALANACVTQAAVTGVGEYRAIAERALGVVTVAGPTAPRAVGWGLASACAVLSGPLEVAIVGQPGDESVETWRWLALMGVTPGLVVASGSPGEDDVPLLRDRVAVDGQPTAYVCRHFTCERPTTDMVEFAARIGARADAFEE